MTALSANDELTYEVRTQTISDVPNLLSLLDAQGGMSWVTGTPQAQNGIVAWGECERIEVDGQERVSRAQRWWNNFCTRTSGDEPVAFTSFAFFSSPTQSVVIAPKVIVRRDKHGTRLTVVDVPEKIEASTKAALSELTDFMKCKFIMSTSSGFPVLGQLTIGSHQSMKLLHESIMVS
jgi:hypothetical protein